ncbi:MAG: hypothetical protein ACLTRS_04075 [Lachnospiraceae bacterium]
MKHFELAAIILEESPREGGRNDFAGLFPHYDVNSNKLGAIVKGRKVGCFWEW